MTNRSLFVISFNSARVISLFTGIGILLIAAKSFSMGASGWAGGIVSLFFLVFPGYIFLKSQRLPIRSWRFDEDHFTVSGRRGHQSLRYDEITRLEPTGSVLDPSSQLRIYVRGQGEPVVLLGNPRSKKLKIDLYSWLREKTRLEFTYSQPS
jgi:hypothetical protein